jgi:hypothetical protein
MTINKTNKDKTLDTVYPEHFAVLKKADLIVGSIPTLGQVSEELLND